MEMSKVLGPPIDKLTKSFQIQYERLLFKIIQMGSKF